MLQHIQSRCDGDHSEHSPPIFFLFPTNPLAQIYTQHDHNHCVIEFYTPVTSLYLPWRNIIGIITATS